MTLAEKVARQAAAVREMREALDAQREDVPSDEWARLDARLRGMERDLDEFVAMVRYILVPFEKPDLWNREEPGT